MIVRYLYSNNVSNESVPVWLFNRFFVYHRNGWCLGIGDTISANYLCY